MDKLYVLILYNDETKTVIAVLPYGYVNSPIDQERLTYGIPLKLMDQHIMDKHIRLTYGIPLKKQLKNN